MCMSSCCSGLFIYNNAKRRENEQICVCTVSFTSCTLWWMEREQELCYSCVFKIWFVSPLCPSERCLCVTSMSWCGILWGGRLCAKKSVGSWEKSECNKQFNRCKAVNIYRSKCTQGNEEFLFYSCKYQIHIFCSFIQ